MALKLTVEGLTAHRAALIRLMGRAKAWPGLRFADVRIVVAQAKYGSALDGAPHAAGADASLGFGARVLAGEPAAPGFFGERLGAADLPRLAARVEAGLRIALDRARESSAHKRRLMATPLGRALYSTRLAPVPAVRARIRARPKKSPRAASLAALQARAEAASRAAARTPHVIHNSTSLVTGLARRLFLSTEGACIDEESLFTQGMLFLIARKGDEIPEENYDYLGARSGLEALDGRNVYGWTFEEFCRRLTAETVELAGSPWCPGTPGPVAVVCDPHFMALVVHETSAGGHPAEADRVLKKETAYAGRSFYYPGPSDNLLGKRIASPLITITVDTSADSYGKTVYDDEGVAGTSAETCQGGILKGFMHSRESAAILGMLPNGCMKAPDPVHVPLVRMPNTYVNPGKTSPAAILRSVRDGWYFCGHRTPSISESRENFTITARRTHRIRNGRLGQLYRGGGLISDTHAFWRSVDRVGTDLKIFGIPNCGKGVPMQTCPVGNGSPTVRARARVFGRKP